MSDIVLQPYFPLKRASTDLFVKAFALHVYIKLGNLSVQFTPLTIVIFSSFA